jgi:hypothetical protein
LLVSAFSQCRCVTDCVPYFQQVVNEKNRNFGWGWANVGDSY